MARRLVACLAAALVAGCGAAEDDAALPPPAKPLGQQVGGSVAPLAQCSDWRGGARERKLATIADIRGQINRDDTGIKAPPLSDTEAMALFDNACRPSYAASFRLYVLYARAAGYAPLRRGR
ncbi:MAG TPA: hypothetical protein VFZ89_00700 [Solirubrobacteraceae bacterium]